MIILNYLLLGGIFLFVINRKSVRFTAGILDASRVGTVGSEVANLGNDALRTDIDVIYGTGFVYY